MNLLYLVVGVIFLLLTVVDMLWTTLWVEGEAGPLTSRLMSSTWTILEKVSGERPRVLSLSGPLILVLGLTMWIALLWGGWTFLFAGGEESLLDTRNTGPISWTERVYFVGYTVFTMGNGDFTPNGGIWRIATALTTASGMFFVTLSVTYVLNVLSAVTQKRSLAGSIHGLGEQSTEILETSWDADSFQGLEVPLNLIVNELDTLTANHKAYPILHYFFTPERSQAPTTNVTVLDETLTLLQFGVEPEHRPSEPTITQARSSVQSYLDTLESEFVGPASQSPPAPDLEQLRDSGIPTVSDEEFTNSLVEVDDRRRLLLGLVESDARSWPNTDSQ
ncbi:potassium channel family protein [Halobacterium sp. R2-5]|uniref:potassium channel family protein n=1 Tax=Halobacterium sp. R2-5 TaxID=2715751 RepID=UPI00141DAEDF|nr:potassium channel family protein [Halobacterium sp. R2-5]NIC00112.1 two pore domain potassium channel family protein [Halobacterium sp. R2-5]